MTDFKIGLDELSTAVGLNDAISDVLQTGNEDPVEAVARSLGVDVHAISRISFGRAMLVMEGAAQQKEGLAHMSSEIVQLSMISAAWLDGFFAALHILEQRNLTKAD
jgi:hypothetical protein